MPMSRDVQPIVSKQTSFEVFRYQLVVDKTLQMDMFNKYQSAEDVRSDKNNILQSLLTNDNFGFLSTQSEITTKLLHTSGNLSYFKVGVRRSQKHYNKDFTEKVLPNYPNILVVFNNHPDIQKIAIQANKSAFSDCKTVSHFINKTIDTRLKKSNLSFFIEPLFDKKEFWNLVNKYSKQIKQVTFNLVSPNMAVISKNLKLNLKELYEDTNTQRTKVELNAEPESYLDIKESSKFVNSLVDYSADGGGNINLRVRGMRKLLHTAQSPNEFMLDENLLKDFDWDKLDGMFNDILI